MAKSSKDYFNELVDAKVRAGLSRADAETVARSQIEEDEKAEAAAKAAAEKAEAAKKAAAAKNKAGDQTAAS